MVTNSGIDLHAGTTLNGGRLMVMPARYEQGQILSYQKTADEWSCVEFGSIVDQDGDGALAWNDCDDLDENLGVKSLDVDCDGTPVAEDCNDNDAHSAVRSEDADCDGIVTALDCNDNDASSTSKSVDADCDGVVTAFDRDDNDAAAFSSNGQSSACAAASCKFILAAGMSLGDGLYWLNPQGTTTNIRAYCD